MSMSRNSHYSQWPRWCAVIARPATTSKSKSKSKCEMLIAKLLFGQCSVRTYTVAARLAIDQLNVQILACILLDNVITYTPRMHLYTRDN